MNNIKHRLEKLTDELESTKFTHPGGRKAYYDQLLAEKEQKAEAAFKKLCNNLILEPSLVRQEAHDTNNSIIGVLSQYMGLEVQEFHRLLRERANLP